MAPNMKTKGVERERDRGKMMATLHVALNLKSGSLHY